MTGEITVVRVEFEREIPPRRFDQTLAAAGLTESLTVDPCRSCGAGGADDNLGSMVATWSSQAGLTPDTRALVLSYCGGMAFGQQLMPLLHPDSLHLVADPVVFTPTTWRDVGQELLSQDAGPAPDGNFAELAALLESELASTVGDLPAFMRDEILDGQLRWVDYVRLAGASTPPPHTTTDLMQLFVDRNQPEQALALPDAVLTEGDPMTSPELSDRCAEIVAMWSGGVA